MKVIYLTTRLLMAFMQRIFNCITVGQLPPFVSVAVVIRDQDKILLLQRADGKGLGLPGGHLKLSETLEAGARREVKEETGLDVELKGIIGTLSGIRKGTWLRVVDVVYEGKIIGGELRDSNEGSCRWVLFDEALENLAFDYIDILKPLLSKDSGKLK